MHFHKKAIYLSMHHHHKQKAAITKWNYFPILLEVFLKQKETDNILNFYNNFCPNELVFIINIKRML